MLEEKKRLSYGLYAVILLLIIGAGRVTMTVYNNVSVDVAYAAWVADLFQYGSDFLNGVKIAFGYGAIAYAVCHISERAGNAAFFLYLGGLFVENAARFLIDYFSSSLSYYGIPLTLVSLGFRFFYEGIFAFAALLISRRFLRRIRNSSEKTEKNAPSASINAARFSVLLFLAAQLLGEVGYLADHLFTYGEMTSQELAVCIGSFLNIAVMYGGIPLLLCEGVFLLMPRLTIAKKQ